MINNSQFDNKNSSSSTRKSLLERLASLRIQSSPPKTAEKSPVTSKSPESPHFIPRSVQTSTKSKFYNYSNSKSSTSSSSSAKLLTASNSQNDFTPSSPLIGRRRKLANVTKTVEASPIGMSSPKYFPKQKVFEIDQPIELKFDLSEESIFEGRQHSAKEVVTSFIDSFTILNNFLNKSTNSTSAKLQLQNMNTSFAALQMDLKAAVLKISQLQIELNEKDQKIKELEQTDDQIQESVKSVHDSELEEQLKIALTQIGEIKLAYDKERENVEFLQNYMEEIIQLKDEGEKKLIKLEKKLSERESSASIDSKNADLLKENESLKETIKLLELERTSNKSVCKQALEVLDAAANTKNDGGEELNILKEELKQKQVEIEKLRGREQHFKESNEIFQQKLMILTEENRKLKGQRPINHY